MTADTHRVTEPDIVDQLLAVVADIAVVSVCACQHLPVIDGPAAGGEHDAHCRTCTLLHDTWAVADLAADLHRARRDLLTAMKHLLEDAHDHAASNHGDHWRDVASWTDTALELLAQHDADDAHS